MKDGEKLFIYVLYDHPKDAPDYYVVRRFVIDQKGDRPELKFVFCSDDMEMIRWMMETVLGKIFMYRNDEDDPVIMGTYI